MDSDFSPPTPSPLYFKVLLKETRERAKICDALSVFLEEYAMLEEGLGKGLIKTANHALAHCKSEWPYTINSTWSSMCVFSEKLGKQHMGYATCISQSIARSFHDHAKASTNELNEIDVKIQSLFYELTKTHGRYVKNLAKYAALVQDAENNIKARDAAVHDFASRGSRDIEAYDGFLNRSLTKMKGSMQVIGKFGPADYLRKMDEKCRLQLEEIDICEDSLANGAKVCNAIRNDLLKELAGCIQAIEHMEKQRIEFMREGFSRFLLACQGMLDHIELLTTEQISLTAAIDFESEMESLQLESIQVVRGAEENESPDPYLTMIAVVEKIKEATEAMKSLIQRSVTAMTELAEANKKYSKNCSRLTEKHGNYVSTAFSKGTSLSDTAAMLRVGSTAPSTQALGSLLTTLESPHTKRSWEAVLASVLKFGESYQTGAEVIVEKCCASADSLQRRVDNSKKEMMESLSSNVKRVDVLQKNLSTVSSKLNRVRRELRDLRDSTGAAASASQEKVNKADGYMSSGEDNNTARHPMDDNLAQPAAVAFAAGDVSETSTVPAIENPSTPSKQRSASMLLPSIPFQSLDPLKLGSKLGAALESASNRKENRIVILEEEEKTLLETESLAVVSLRNNQESATAELIALSETSKQNLSRDLLNIKMVLQILMDCHRLSLEICQKALISIRKEAESSDIDSDFELFLVGVRTTSTGIAEGSSSYPLDGTHSGGTKASFATFEIPPEDNFVPLHNPIVAMEKQNRCSSVMSPVIEDEQNIRTEIAETVTMSEKDLSADGTVVAGGELTELRRSIGEEAGFGMIEHKEVEQLVTVLNEGVVASEEPVKEVVQSNHKKRKSKTKKSSSFSNEELSIPSVDNVEVLPVDVLNPDSNDISEANGLVVTAPSILEEPRIITNSDITLKSSPDRIDSSTPSGSVKPVNPFYVGSPAAPAEEAYVPVGEAADKVLESFSCALYPKRGILTHGRISITTKNLLFSGWPECKLLIPLHDITSIEKTNSLMIIPNSLLITVTSGEEYFFGSFMERELCYSLLNSLVMVSRHLYEITEPSAKAVPEGSEMHKNDSDVCKVLPAEKADSQASTELVRENHDKTTIAPQDNAEDMEDEHSSDEDGSLHTDYEKYFKSDSMYLMHSQELPVKSKYVWQYFWKNAEGYRDYLTSQGDQDITFTEWEISKENPVEDLCKLKYAYSRKMDFFHPRTDPMINYMGPKNAPAQQMQYLYVESSWNGKDLSEMKYHRGIIFTVTQFRDIPMADVFKVLQYWAFEPKKKLGGPSLHSHSCIVKMYVAIHYNKFTMLKGSILSGTKDDLTVFVKKWCMYVIDKISQSPSMIKKRMKKRRKSSLKVIDIAASDHSGFSVPDGEGIAQFMIASKSQLERLEELINSDIKAREKQYQILLMLVAICVAIIAIQFFLLLGMRSGIRTTSTYLLDVQKDVAAVLLRTKKI